MKHKVFISFYNGDLRYKEDLIRRYGHLFINGSVDTGDIPDTLTDEQIRTKIRDNYLADTSVTVVLVGPETKNRKHVDWEVSSSLRDTKYNKRAGVVVFLLPEHPDYGTGHFNRNNLPKRLADNISNGYVEVYDYPVDYNERRVLTAIERAYARRDQNPAPDNSEPLRRRNSEKENRWF